MKNPLIVTYLNIHLAEYLAVHPEELPKGIAVNTKSYLRTEYGYAIDDFENKPYDYSEKIEIKIEFVDYGTEYFPYEIEYSIGKGLVSVKLLSA